MVNIGKVEMVLFSFFIRFEPLPEVEVRCKERKPRPGHGNRINSQPSPWWFIFSDTALFFEPVDKSLFW